MLQRHKDFACVYAYNSSGINHFGLKKDSVLQKLPSTFQFDSVIISATPQSSFT